MIKRSVKKLKVRVRSAISPGYEDKKLSGMRNCKRYARFDIGEYTYGRPEVYEWEGTLKIGRFCSIAPKVSILLGGNHFTDKISTYPFSHYFKKYTSNHDRNTKKNDVVIGSDVWIGFGVSILAGVTIGHGAVLGARSVISKDVEPYSIVIGNPAVAIKKRFDDETIAKLLKSEWWTKDISVIKKNVELLQSNDVDAFLKAIA